MKTTEDSLFLMRKLINIIKIRVGEKKVQEEEN